MEVSVFGGEVSVQGRSLSKRGSLSKGAGVCQGDALRTAKGGQYVSYWNAFLFCSLSIRVKEKF